MNTESGALLLHLTDSAFPTGGYAHSFGLEEIVRTGEVRNEESLREFLFDRIRPALRQLELPLLREAHSAAVREDLARLLEIDGWAGAFRLTREARDASRRIGRRRLAVLGKIREDRFLEAYSGAISEREGHHVVVFAAACRTVPLHDVMAAFYYQTMAGYALASLKLIRIGQEGVHRVLAATLEVLEPTAAAALNVPMEEIGWFDPGLDLAAMAHEIARERLFIS